VLARQRIPADWIGIVFDRRNMIVVRTRRVEEFLGRSLSPDLVAVLGRGAPEGWAVTRTLEGTPVYTAYARSPKTGWGIAFGIPRASVDAPLERSLLAIGAGGVAFAVLALALAALVGRRITAPMATLADAARHFGEGGTMHADGPAGVSEVDDVRQAFVGAAALVQQRAAEAEAAARAKDQFLAVVSHELRTPLNAVYGWARMLQSGQVGEEQMKRALDVIVRQSDAQVQLIDDLLDVSRVISGKMRLDVRPLELTAVVEQALDAVRPAAAAKEIRLESVLDPRTGVVAGDPDRLRQVTWNLLMIAVKFTPSGGRVQARLQRANLHVEIVVSDTGRGIAPDGITAQSAGDGQGATFVVRLPLAFAEPAPGRAARAHPMTDSASAAGARLDDLRVLVVDDDREALDLAVAILAGAGALVRVCASAPEALEALRTWRPDVLVSDIEMPGEDGYTLIRKVRALGAAEGGHTPAVALTAYGRPQDRGLSLTAGYNMHVPKPVDPGEFTAIIASVAQRGTAA